MHSPRSPVYGENLARCGLPPSFFQSVIAYVPTGCQSVTQSAMYGKTLARCTRAVYPPIFSRTASRRWASVFLLLWLGHMYV
jgi:hypothetical protein